MDEDLADDGHRSRNDRKVLQSTKKRRLEKRPVYLPIYGLYYTITVPRSTIL